MPVDLAGNRLYSLDDLRSAVPANVRPSREAFRRLLKSGKIRGRKIGRTWFVSAAAIAAYFGETFEPNPFADQPKRRKTHKRHDS